LYQMLFDSTPSTWQTLRINERSHESSSSSSSSASHCDSSSWWKGE